MSLFFKGNFIFVCDYFPCMQVCAPFTCLMPVEARRELKTLGIRVKTVVNLGIKPRSYKRAVSTRHLSSPSMVSYVLLFKTNTTLHLDFYV